MIFLKGAKSGGGRHCLPLFSNHISLFRQIFLSAAIALSTTTSCIRDDYSGCGVWLEFVFDLNMEYADSFYPQVGEVDVYVFDGSGKYLFKKHAESSALHGRNRMFLGGLPFGNYRILTVGGGLGGDFRFAAADGTGMVPGVTTVEQVRLWLAHEGTVGHELPGLWFGTVDIPYRANLSVWRVPLVRETNRFDITVQQPVAAPPCTVEIIAPEAGAYDHRNYPLTNESVVYKPYYLSSETGMSQQGDDVRLTAAKINTMRLLESVENGYRLVVRNAETGDEIWAHDLIALLAETKPANRPDGTPLPLQEYLDREGEWEITIILGGRKQGDGFTALRVIVNGWIVWEHGVGV